MKNRFNTYDIICSISELQRLVGMRVNQVYDIDNKTYLIRLQKSEEKSILLIESGNRFHTTQFEWPKNVAPSGFSMKLRKHLKNKRLESLNQLGIDRIVDFQFGSGEAAYHVILELYDRGNVILTDCNWIILNVLRPHTEGDKIRIAVKEKYPLDRAKPLSPPPSSVVLKEMLLNSKPGDNLKKILNPNLEFGPAIIDHVLSEVSLAGNLKVARTSESKGFNIDSDLPKLEEAIQIGQKMLMEAMTAVAKGYVIQKKEERPKPEVGDVDFLFTNIEFHPMLFNQHKSQPHKEFETFDRAVDEFFSTVEGQKIDLKAVHIEREAMKKLSNVKKDHDKRLTELDRVQKDDRNKAELITRNQELVDNAIVAIQAALANQMSWDDIRALVKSAQERNDPIATCIKHLKLEKNHISLMLSDPYSYSDDSDNNEDAGMKPTVVDIDLALTAFSNARRYYDQKRFAAKKQMKTIESQGKALKSAEKKTIQTLKEVQAITSINKARKAYWFEKFFWFISSENYLVIGGRDQQQNELLVKRYMRSTDVYVHADLSGASSIIIKNPTGNPVPPKTLNEAGQVAVAYSVAWEAKVLTSAWWVNASQVSKSAPTGEYLTTGSFMIRGKKNYLLPSQLTLGFSFMFRLEESSIERHLGERKVHEVEDNTVGQENEQPEQEGEEIVLSEDEETSEKQSENKNDGEPSSDEEAYPDTHIKIEHDTGKVIIQRTMSETISEEPEHEGDEEPYVFPALPSKGKKQAQKKVAQERDESQDKDKENIDGKTSNGGAKRGQKGKLKKMKLKYKDQDDDDRALMMDILKSAGPQKEAKKTSKKNAPQQKKPQNEIKFIKPQIKIEPQILEANESDGEAGDNEPEPQGPSVDTDMLCQLTGIPLPEDELLFSVPVIAPYSALQNYKYKVKLTPGTGKRGKAAKTSVQIFLKDKHCTHREKDLLKAVKEENIARNFPGKVKISAPQLQKRKN